MPSLARIIPATFVVLWATGFIGARYAMPWAEPFSFLALRFGLAIAFFAALAVWQGARRATPREAAHSAIAGAMMHGVYLAGVFWSVRHGMPAGLSALIVGLQPVMTALLAGAFLGEKILPRHWTGLAVGFVGVVMVLWPKLGAVGEGVTAATLTASTIAVAAMSAGTLWQKKFVGQADLLSGAIWQYVGGAALTGIAAVALETGAYQLTGELVFAMAWAVLVLSVGAIFLLMVMIRDGALSKVASLFYLVPAVTAVIAWFLFGEELNAIQIAGMAITTFGVALATRRTDPPATAA